MTTKRNLIPVLLAAGALALASCSSAPSEPAYAPEPSVSEAAEPEVPQAKVDDLIASVTAGTLEDPYALGTASEGATWTLSVDQVKVDGVNDLLDQDGSNDPEYGTAPENGQFVLAEVTLVNTSAVVGKPEELVWGNVFALLGSDAIVYGTQLNYFADDAYPQLISRPDVLPGGTVTGWVIFDVDPEALGDLRIGALSGDTGQYTVWSATGTAK